MTRAHRSAPGVSRGKRLTRTTGPFFGMLISLAALPAASHHGFSGRYDFTRPLLVEGVIADWQSDRVHVEFEVDTWPTDVDEAKRVFAGLPEIEGRPLNPLPIAPRNRVRIEVDPIMSRRIIANSSLPDVGETVRLIAYCRFSDDNRRGWLRVMAIELPDGTVRMSSRRSYHVVPGGAEKRNAHEHCQEPVAMGPSD